MQFDEATTVTPLDDGHYEAVFPVEYALAGVRPNGGYVVACLARAALHAAAQAGASHRHVIALGAQFISTPPLGPATLTATVLRVGKTAAHVQATTDGVLAFFTLGTLHDESEPYWGTVPPVTLAPLEECAPAEMFTERGMTLLFDPETSITMGADGPKVTGNGEFRCWLVEQQHDAVDTVGLVYVADCVPPATFGAVFNGFAPTLNMAVYVRAVPAPGPLRIRFRAQMIQDGFADEVCEIWDSSDRLVAQSTQVIALRVPG